MNLTNRMKKNKRLKKHSLPIASSPSLTPEVRTTSTIHETTSATTHSSNNNNNIIERCKFLRCAQSVRHTQSVTVIHRGIPNEIDSITNAPNIHPMESMTQVISTCFLPDNSTNRNLSNENPIDPSHTSPSLSLSGTSYGSVYVKPLLVLDLNGILCRRVRSYDTEILLDTLFHTNETMKHHHDHQDNHHTDFSNDLNPLIPSALITTQHQKQQQLRKPPKEQLQIHPPHHHQQQQLRQDYQKNNIYRQYNTTVAGTPIIHRTDLHTFLTFLDAHFTLAVWTSAKKKTAKSMIHNLFPSSIAHRLLFVWGQEKCESHHKNHTMVTHDTCTIHQHDASLSLSSSSSCSWNDHDGSHSNTIQNTNHSIKDTQYNQRSLDGKQKLTNRMQSQGKGIDPKDPTHPDHPRNVIFIKSLAKVWNQYPLWNSSNTLLVDDSPEKCPMRYRKNAIHPPPILGIDSKVLLSLSLSVSKGTESHLYQQYDDEVNQTQQMLFFERLIHVWKEPFSTSSSSLLSAVTVQSSPLIHKKEDRSIPCEQDHIVHPISSENGHEKLFRFLNTYGRDHMGWKG